MKRKSRGWSKKSSSGRCVCVCSSVWVHVCGECVFWAWLSVCVCVAECVAVLCVYFGCF